MESKKTKATKLKTGLLSFITYFLGNFKIIYFLLTCCSLGIRPLPKLQSLRILDSRFQRYESLLLLFHLGFEVL
jgi:hypothetical protein